MTLFNSYRQTHFMRFLSEIEIQNALDVTIFQFCYKLTPELISSICTVSDCLTDNEAFWDFKLTIKFSDDSNPEWNNNQRTNSFTTKSSNHQ